MRFTNKDVGFREGFRSGLEERVGEQIAAAGLEVKYETEVIAYTKPTTKHKYKPDFPLPNGIIIETKGRFLLADRQKHLLIQAQHPEKDIRFVFSYSKGKIAKGSKTTYADWCRKNGFKFADKLIPDAWLKEKPKKNGNKI